MPGGGGGGGYVQLREKQEAPEFYSVLHNNRS